MINTLTSTRAIMQANSAIGTNCEHRSGPDVCGPWTERRVTDQGKRSIESTML